MKFNSLPRVLKKNEYLFLKKNASKQFWGIFLFKKKKIINNCTLFLKNVKSNSKFIVSKGFLVTFYKCWYLPMCCSNGGRYFVHCLVYCIQISIKKFKGDKTFEKWFRRYWYSASTTCSAFQNCNTIIFDKLRSMNIWKLKLWKSTKKHTQIKFHKS